MIKVRIKDRDILDAENLGYHPTDIAIARILRVFPEYLEIDNGKVKVYNDADELESLYSVPEDDWSYIIYLNEEWDFGELFQQEDCELIPFSLKKMKVSY